MLTSLAREEAQDRISEEISHLHETSYGEKVVAVRTSWDHDIVYTLLDVHLMPNEQLLVDSGIALDTIGEVRRQFQQTLKPAFIAAVERATGRSVIAFLSSTHLDPSFSIEIFRLARTGPVAVD